MNQTPVKTRRKFDETFKREAVQNWRNSSKSAEVIAQELGINANRLYAWQKRFAPAAVEGRAATDFAAFAPFARQKFKRPFAKAQREGKAEKQTDLI